MTIAPEVRQQWEAMIAKSSGSYDERNLLVPYSLEDTHEAMLKTIKKVNFIKVFEEDSNSKSMLFGQKNAFVSRIYNFKGMIIIEPASFNQTSVYVKIKRKFASSYLQGFFNQFTNILENEYQRADVNAPPAGNAQNSGGEKSSFAAQEAVLSVGGGKSNFFSNIHANPDHGVETEILDSAQYRQKESSSKKWAKIVLVILVLILIWRLILIAMMNS